MSTERCMYCNGAVPEGKNICPNCEDWLIMRRSGKSALTAHGYDGGSMTIADVMRELGVMKYDAVKVMLFYGAISGKHRVISRREFMYRKQNGDIEKALNTPMPKTKSIEKAISLLQMSLIGCAGYVRIGDTIRDPTTGHPLYGDGTENCWIMPMFCHEVWNMRRMADTLGQIMGVDPDKTMDRPITDPVPVIAVEKPKGRRVTAGQMMFDFEGGL